MTTFTDNFNRADGDPGVNYTTLTGGWDIVSNALQANSSGDNFLFRNDTLANDQEVYATLAITGTDNYTSVAVRASGASFAALNAYVFSTDPYTGGGSSAIQKAVAGSFSTLKSVSAAFADGDEIGIKVVTVGADAVITVYKNGVQVDTYTDTSSPHASGKAGLGNYRVGGTQPKFDDIHGGDVGGAGISGTLGATEGASDTLASSGNVGNNGVRLTLRDTDTGALAVSLSGIKMSIRAASDSTTLIASSASKTTDANGVIEHALGSAVSAGTYVYVTIEKSDNSIVATYRVQVIDLNA